MAIPKFVQLYTESLPLNQAQANVAQSLNPLIANPLMQGLSLTNVPLLSGYNLINHTLGRPLVGWFVTRLRAPASIYDLQDSNTTPQYNLALESSADVVVDIYVY